MMNNLDDRLRAYFLDSYLGFLANVPEIQFSAQLIQALVCQGIHCDPLSYIANLVPFSDLPVQFLDDLARSVVGPQFHDAAPASGENEGSAAGDEHDDESGVGAEDDETSVRDNHQTPKDNGDDGSKADDSGESGRDPSSKTGASDSKDE
ncbi:Hypothetical predicted protein [Olea europaea subsp. europaea]|uniref:Uncharacterized protein n=1 Tax=Olea europaea subsp. europaea TaxID=158383 RepID=A0A8S0T9R6_OLEEU|nr:Hypothetical predicted protein [Olea europaea subsp. europaea]